MHQRKFNTLVEAPIQNNSGYGRWADALAVAAIKYPPFNTSIFRMPWGDCPLRTLDEENDKLLSARVLKDNKITRPDVHIAVGLPHMTKPKGGVFNINITAGLEADRLPDYFMKAANYFDLSIVLSEYTKSTYFHSANHKFDKQIEVLHWGLNTTLYNPNYIEDTTVSKLIYNIDEPEIFLFVGQVTSPELFLDRKNIFNLLKDFCTAFNHKKSKPALILKINGVVYSIQDRNAMIDKINQVKQMIPNCDVNVYLLHGELTEQQLNTLYNHPRVVCFVTETRGEGQGGSIAQMSLVGKPILAPSYSGYLDFLDDKYVKLEGKLDEIADKAYTGYFQKGSYWFEVDHPKAVETLRDFYYNDRSTQNNNAKLLADINKTMELKFHSILNKYLLVS